MIQEPLILASARKRGIPDNDILSAMNTPLSREQLKEEPPKWLYRGFDRSGRPLEIISVIADNGREYVIHAMKLRKTYYPGGR